MPLSRRAFFQSFGITLAGSLLTVPGGTTALNGTDGTPPSLWGRALQTTPIYAGMRTTMPVIRRLWEDDILPIEATHAQWLRVSDGFIQRQALQPVVPYPAATLTAPPFWGEVTQASTAVHHWCAPDAPIITRIGFGGISQIIDHLTSADRHWYALADADHHILGWSRAEDWTPVSNATVSPSGIVLIERSAYQASLLLQDGSIALQAQIALGQPLISAGVYALEQRTYSGTITANGIHYHGAPWQTVFAHEAVMSGVYWHHRFGATVPGCALQLPISFARAIFHHAETVMIV